MTRGRSLAPASFYGFISKQNTMGLGRGGRKIAANRLRFVQMNRHIGLIFVLISLAVVFHCQLGLRGKTQFESPSKELILLSADQSTAQTIGSTLFDTFLPAHHFKKESKRKTSLKESALALLEMSPSERHCQKQRVQDYFPFLSHVQLQIFLL